MREPSNTAKMQKYSSCEAGGPTAMPFDTGFRIYPWVEKLLAIRHRPVLAHVLAIILVLIAVVVREAVAEATGPQVPFITFYPAIILAALIGGLWPGIVATLLSTLVA